ncbi:hypothetical protein B4099_3354 [Heyndrickxia coagulans]|uniref:Uncharacterized protein n=1 Tax=Heyndrickxia coagulans TaxID=1398 RepID=A0A150K724_HEYCO|nr:hypothetical protein B4099_3354 [Heyndrickxia coagulans]
MQTRLERCPRRLSCCSFGNRKCRQDPEAGRLNTGCFHHAWCVRHKKLFNCGKLL